MFDLSLQQVRTATVTLIALILSIAVHEFGHAFVADKLGDGTPRSQGRVTLNPLVHADPFGTFLFPLVGLLMSSGILFGWGRPVMVNPLAFSRKFRMKTAHLFVAAAGPAMNVLLALFVTLVYGVLIGTGIMSVHAPIAGGIRTAIALNWILCFFNLIPCPPLDGGTILAGFLPDRHQHIIAFLQQYGFFILLALLITGMVRFFVVPALWLTQTSLQWVHAVVM